MNNKKIFWLIISLAFFLRIYKISDFPPGLYSDEAAYGYNAYSLLKTGRDEYGISWPLTLKNFGDYKPPMTAWLTIPSIAVFGLNEFAVRLPSVIAGTITVAIIYFLTLELFPRSKKFSILNSQFSIPEVTALLLTISPWHLHFSRSSMLVGIEAMFISGGLLFFLKSLKRPRLIYLSVTSFVAAIYTYYGSRVTIPLLIITLVIIFRQELKNIKAQVITSVFLGTVLLAPLGIAIYKDAAVLTGRAKTISVFFDPGIKARLWEAHSIDGIGFSVYLSRFFHNKFYFYSRDIAQRYLQHFSYQFLVKSGDSVPPFDIAGRGVIYFADAIFIILGIYGLTKLKHKYKKVLVAYIIISPIPAALTFITPAANRSFNLSLGLVMLSAFGIYTLFKLIRKKTSAKPILWVILLIYLISFAKYLNTYYQDIPQKIAYKWHYGRNQLVKKVNSIEDNFEKIVFSPREGPAYIWLLFYNQIEPQKYWTTSQVNQNPNELGWFLVESFGKYIFLQDFDFATIEKDPKFLYVGYEDEIPQSWEGEVNGQKYFLVIDEKILYPNGDTAFKIAHFEPSDIQN